MSRIYCDCTDNLNEKIKQDWNTLWDTSAHAHFFNKPEWTSICEEVFNYKIIKYVYCYKDDEMISIMPLAEVSRLGGKLFESPGGRYFDSSPLLFKENGVDTLIEIIGKINSQNNIYLSELPLSVASKITTSFSGAVQTQTSISPYLPINPDPLRFFSKNKYNYLMNKLRRYGGDFLLTEKECNDEGGISFLREVERQSYKNKKDKDIFSIKNYSDLYKTIVKRLKNSVVIHVMYHNSVPIAYDVGFLSKNTFIAHNKAFLYDYKSISPGKIMPLLYLHKLQKIGIETFDMSRGNDELKREYSPYIKIKYGVFMSKSSIKKTTFFIYKKGLGYLENKPIIYNRIRIIKRKLINNRMNAEGVGI